MAVALSSGIRDTLVTIQNTVAEATIAQTRLATGNKVNSALDSPIAYFASQSLTQRAGDLSILQDNMEQAVRTLTAASTGLDGMTKLLQTAQGIANSAAGESDQTRRATLATQFNAILAQVDELMKNSGYGGINLLNGDKLSLSFDPKATTSTIVIQSSTGSAGVTGSMGLTSSQLGVATASAASWTNASGATGGDVGIKNSLTALSTAIATLRIEASGLGSSQAIVAARQSFTTSMVNTLKGGAGDLTLADMNEEGAKLSALNTRGQLAQQALSLASQRDQQVLQLLRG